MIEQYIPIVEELISQVRARQHKFNNRIFAIDAAVNAAESLDATKEVVSVLAKDVISKEDKRTHGFGLYNLLQIVERHHGKILTRNEQIGQENYVVFGVILP